MFHKYEPIGEKRYKALEKDKAFFINTAKDCCRYTIPTLLMYFEENINSHYDVEQPYQCLGANGISNLASKLLTALTPSNLPFFKFMISDYGLMQERSKEIADFRVIVDKMLSDYALQVTDLIKTSNDTSFLYEMWQLLLVSGNVLIKDPDDNSNIRVYSLRDYCVKRDRAGTPLEIVLKGVSKASAVKIVAQEYGVDLQNCIAFGDNYNDEDMLEEVGYPFLMGNAPAELKQKFAPEQITADNNHDGVAKALAKIE